MSTNTDGGTTVSLDNTPQAVDDFYGASFGATEDQVYILDVMANDLGGKAKTLWSIDNSSCDGSGDLVAKDVAGCPEYSELGARIWLTADGKIAYDTNALDSLPAGETAIDHFTYAIRMSNGTLSWATVCITVVGTNDAPVVQAVAITAVEDGAAVAASFSGDDIDTDDDAASLTYAITSSPAEGSVVNNADGTFTFNPGTDFQDLAEGETRQVTFTYTATDSHGAVSNTATVTVTVTGTNDAPVVQNVAVAADEDGVAVTASFDGDDIDSDDDGASLVYAISSDPAEGSVVNNDDGTFTFNPGTDFQDLAEGETRQVSFTYTATDSHGSVSSSGTVTVTVTGTNDAPVVSGAVLATVDEDDANPASVNLLANASDPDASDDLDVASVDYSVTGGAWAAAVAYSVDAETGALTFDPGQFNALAVSESIELTFTYNVIDGNGGVTSATTVITITGTNDAPVVSGAVLATVDEDDTNPASVNLLANASDPDASDDLDVASVDYSVTGGAWAAAVAYSVDAETGALTFDPGQFNALAVSESIELTFTYNVIDGNGGVTSATAVITITGSNDAPNIHVVTTDTASATLVETNAGLATAGTLTVNDPDSSDVVSSSVTAVVASGTTAGLGLTNAQLLAMLGVTPTSGLAANAADLHNLTWNFNSGTEAFNYLNAGQSLILTYTVTSSDGNGGSDTQDVTVTVNGTADATPTDLVFTVTNAPAGNSLPNGAFGQISVVDGSGGGGYTYAATNLSATTLAGGVAVNFAGDLTISAAGVVSATNLDDNRIYELTVQASQGATNFSETFSVITGTNVADSVGGPAANGDDVIIGEGAADVILAGSGNDALFGQAGDDQIHGGDGNDTLTGGGNNDQFFFDTALDATLNVDQILDFNANSADQIVLENGIFASLAATGALNSANFASNVGGNAVDASDFILFDSSNGNLYYDADGSGAGARILVATIALTGGTFDHGDFLII